MRKTVLFLVIALAGYQALGFDAPDQVLGLEEADVETVPAAPNQEMADAIEGEVNHQLDDMGVIVRGNIQVSEYTAVTEIDVTQKQDVWVISLNLEDIDEETDPLPGEFEFSEVIETGPGLHRIVVEVAGEEGTELVMADTHYLSTEDYIEESVDFGEAPTPQDPEDMDREDLENEVKVLRSQMEETSDILLRVQEKTDDDVIDITVEEEYEEESLLSRIWSFISSLNPF